MRVCGLPILSVICIDDWHVAVHLPAENYAACQECAEACDKSVRELGVGGLRVLSPVDAHHVGAACCERSCAEEQKLACQFSCLWWGELVGVQKAIDPLCAFERSLVLQFAASE